MSYRSNSFVQYVSCIVFTFYLLPTLCCSEDLVQRFNMTELFGLNQFRLVGIATTSPTAENMRRNKTAITEFNALVDLFQKYLEVMKNRKTEKGLNVCNVLREQYREDSLYTSKIRQIGELKDPCDGILDARKSAKRGEMDSVRYFQSVRQTQQNAEKALFRALRNIPQIPSTSDMAQNWTEGTFRVANWQIPEDGQTCTYEKSFAHRINGHWYIRAELTNEPVTKVVDDYARHYIGEFVREDLGTSLQTIQPIYDGSKRGTNGSLIKATTVMERWGGRPGLSPIGNHDFNEIPALVEAVRAKRVAVDLASDAVTISNIAIVLLPISMTLIPVAFLTELNTIANLCYLIFTDIISVVPLFIQGVELILAAKPIRTVIVRKTGNDTFLQMDIGSAECIGEKKFRYWGIALIIISVISMIIGVGLEFYGEMMMRRRRQEGKQLGPFGMAGFEVTKEAMIGRLTFEEVQERILTRLRKRTKDRLKNLGVRSQTDDIEKQYLAEKERRYSREASNFAES